MVESKPRSRGSGGGGDRPHKDTALACQASKETVLIRKAKKLAPCDKSVVVAINAILDGGERTWQHRMTFATRRA
jgi:hypothetical protein